MELDEAVAELDEAVVEHLLFKDSFHVRLALQVMGLMCDGQYRLMQNYLREQRDNIHTIDLVGGVASFLQHFYQDINEETVELVHLMLQTLIEMCVGNYSNQLVIFNQQILEALSVFELLLAALWAGCFLLCLEPVLKAGVTEVLSTTFSEVGITKNSSADITVESSRH